MQTTASAGPDVDGHPAGVARRARQASAAARRRLPDRDPHPDVPRGERHRRLTGRRSTEDRAPATRSPRRTGCCHGRGTSSQNAI